MNGIDCIADTNILIYILEANPKLKDYFHYRFCISIITEMEMLGKYLVDTEEKNIKKLVENFPKIDLTLSIKHLTAMLVQKHKTKLPYAVIAATAIYFQLPLLSSYKGLIKIKELDFKLLEL